LSIIDPKLRHNEQKFDRWLIYSLDEYLTRFADQFKLTDSQVKCAVMALHQNHSA
jgi:hypothetical protein